MGRPWTSTFAVFGASPVSIDLAEGCPALQAKVVDGPQNKMTPIHVAKFCGWRR